MFCQTIEGLLIKHCITARDLSKATGITEGRLSSLRRGRTSPNAKDLAALSNYFGVSVDSLLERKEEGVTPIPATPVMTDREKKMLELFRQLPRDDQLIFMGRLMERVEALQRDTDHVSAGRVIHGSFGGGGNG